MSSRKYLNGRRQRKQLQNSALVLIMIGGVVLVAGTLIFAVINSSRANLLVRQITLPEFTEGIPAEGNALGDPNAPVMIEEFSDFGCNHCADFALETKKVLEEEYIKTGQVYLVFHSVGGLLNSPATLQAAEAAYCAADQNAFWPFHDTVFANQIALFGRGSADITGSLINLAKALGLDSDQLGDCLAEGRYSSRAAADQVLAAQNGITGTPSFMINGELYVGNLPYENFQRAIESALGTALDPGSSN